MGGRDYWEALYILPLLVSGYVFYQWAYVYMRNCIFAKRTIWNAVSVVAGGSSNIVISYYLIPFYGVLGVSIAFSLSYLVLLLTSYLINKFILKIYAPNGYAFFKLLMMTLPFGLISGWMYHVDMPFVFCLVTKTAFFILASLLILYRFKSQIISLIRPYIYEAHQ